MFCVSGEDTDQPAHLDRLIGVFTGHSFLYGGRKPLREGSEDWGQAVGVRRLIGVLAACTSSCGSDIAPARVLE